MAQRFGTWWYHHCVIGTIDRMATNLRLGERTAKALREAAASTGKSQQQLIREALDAFLGLDPEQTDRERALASGMITAGTPFEDFEPFLVLPEGVTTVDLLDRDER